ncbi:MAG TPA: RagB/SusD family nutrient uptake outer membrane protein [Bacteroidales bacterium]|nr:RagB/SusD family nutrient uptake outer membrane protein [Bacteroidales bacterium]
MKYTTCRFLLFTMLIATMSSCESYLDPGFDQTLTKDDVFSSYEYSLNYVRTIYSYLPNGNWEQSMMTDEAKHTDEASAFLNMNNGSWTSRTYVDSWTWSHFYAGIRRVHIFLDNVDKSMFLDENTFKLTPNLNDTARKQFRAEARFLRAFYYFELLKRFGDPAKNLGVPIVPEKVLTINDTLDFARNSYEECVNYIVNDCDQAAIVLPSRQEGSNYGKASKAAALALKSRVLLYAASPLANPTGDVEKWKLAAAAAAQVMNLASVPFGANSYTYRLIDKTTVANDNMLSVFTKPNNDEVLFSSPVTQSNGFESSNLPPSFGGGGQLNPTQDLVDAFETTIGYPITDSRSGYRPTDPYYRRDKRLVYFIALNGSLYGVAVPKETPAALAARTLDSYVGGKDGLNSSKNASKTGYYIRKFVDPNADILLNRTVATHFWVHFRYAEILLNYAEAMTEAYGVTTAAYDALKLVRDRAGLVTPTTVKTLSKEDFLLRVRNERRVELCFEGHRYWDVRRLKQGETYFNVPIHGMRITKNGTVLTYEVFKVEDRVFDAKMYAMPLPYDEMQKSKLLIQNEGW